MEQAGTKEVTSAKGTGRIAPLKTSLTSKTKHITSEITTEVNGILIIDLQVAFGGDIIEVQLVVAVFCLQERFGQYINIRAAGCHNERKTCPSDRPFNRDAAEDAADTAIDGELLVITFHADIQHRRGTAAILSGKSTLYKVTFFTASG